MKEASGGSNGSGGVGGRSADAGARAFATAKAGIKGLDAAGPGRSLKVHNAAYDGLSKKEVNRVATGQRPTANSRSAFDPIKITAEPGGRGKTHWVLSDGNHRLAAARAAGATKIRATIRSFDTKGRERVKTLNIPLPKE